MPSIDRDLTEEELAEARERWAGYTPAQQVSFMKNSLGAKEAHSQVVDPVTGRRAFGGPQPGAGRIRKPRLAEKVAELAQGTRQREIIDALFSGLAKGNDVMERVKTAKIIADMEHKERLLQINEDRFERELSDASKDELLDIVTRGLLQAVQRGDLPDMRELAEKIAAENDRNGHGRGNGNGNGSAPREPYDVDGSVAD